MSGFNRVQRPEDATRGVGANPDRFEAFKATAARVIDYRNAYFNAAQAGVSLIDVPHPDTVDGTNIDAAEAALKAVRQAGATQRLRAVPGEPDVQG